MFCGFKGGKGWVDVLEGELEDGLEDSEDS
jgi:hypothetical protein